MCIHNLYVYMAPSMYMDGSAAEVLTDEQIMWTDQIPDSVIWELSFDRNLIYWDHWDDPEFTVMGITQHHCYEEGIVYTWPQVGEEE